MEAIQNKIKLILSISLAIFSTLFFSVVLVFAAQTLTINNSIIIEYRNPKVVFNGETFNETIPDDCVKIVFDKYSEDYNSLVSDENVSEIILNNANIGLNDGGVCLYYDENNKTSYVLCKDGIVANNDCSFMFSGKTSLTSVEFKNFETKNVTDMEELFSGCTNLTSISLENLNTSSVTDMTGVFKQCINLEILDLSKFNTENVKYAEAMFQYCTKLKTIYVGSDWDMSGIEDGYDNNMFLYCLELTGQQGTRYYDILVADSTYAKVDGGAADPGYLTTKYTLVNGATFKGLIANDCTKIIFGKYSEYASTVDDSATIQSCAIDETGKRTLDIGAYYVGTTMYVLSSGEIFANEDCSNMFNNAQSLINVEFNNFNTSNTINMSGMFWSCKSLSELDLTNFDTTKVADMGTGILNGMFTNCSGLTNIIFASDFDVSNLKSIGCMFYNCSSLTSLDLTSFRTQNITRMYGLFNGCLNLKTIYVSSFWTVENVTDSSYMFTNCNNLVGQNGTTYMDVRVANSKYAKVDGGAADPGYLTLKAN